MHETDDLTTLPDRYTTPTSDTLPNELDAPEPLSVLVRLLLAAVGLTMLTLLTMASQLTPDPSGRGTHQQLGLPPCTFVYLYGLPCPSCGMTTSWSAVMHGQLPTALEANLAGTLLALCALVGGPWTLWSALRGAFPRRSPSDYQLAMGAVGIATIAILQWLYRVLL